MLCLLDLYSIKTGSGPGGNLRTMMQAAFVAGVWSLFYGTRREQAATRLITAHSRRVRVRNGYADCGPMLA